MADPVILSSYDAGRHAADLNATINRIDQDAGWKDLSCAIVTPAGGSVPTRVVASWLGMMTPPNNRVVRLTAIGLEVGEAYSRCIESLLAHPELSTWKYLCTIEHDNAPPSDGLVRLLRQMEVHPEYAAI